MTDVTFNEVEEKKSDIPYRAKPTPFRGVEIFTYEDFFKPSAFRKNIIDPIAESIETKLPIYPDTSEFEDSRVSTEGADLRAGKINTDYGFYAEGHYYVMIIRHNGRSNSCKGLGALGYNSCLEALIELPEDSSFSWNYPHKDYPNTDLAWSSGTSGTGYGSNEYASSIVKPFLKKFKENPALIEKFVKRSEDALNGKFELLKDTRKLLK